jgi:hypothetical protein
VPDLDPPPNLARREDSRRLSLVVLCLLALSVGIVTGLGAVLFRDLIGLIHNVMFAWRPNWRYDANVFTAPAPWGPWVILVPVIGAVIVTFLVNTFAPEAKGHGVPEVMDAIYYKGGVIRPVVAIVKSLASAVAIGSGSSVGREGPIIQIGSALGSTLGQIVRMPVGQRITLVAAGAGAGIAATFNTPIGGVMFAIELMLPEVSVDTFLPVALATGAATFIGRWALGDQPARRVLSRETIYSLKLVRRGRAIPKALHANMFLVRRASEAMDTDVVVLPADTAFDEFLRRPENDGGLRHVVTTRRGRLYGVLRVNTSLSRGLEGARTGVTVGDVSSRHFIVVGEDRVVFDVIERMWRKHATMTVVVKGRGVPRGKDVVGVITKEHVADSVASSVSLYPHG